MSIVSANFHHDFGLANRLFIFAVTYAYAKKHGKKMVFLKDFYHRSTIHSRIDDTNIFFSGIPFQNSDGLNLTKYNEKLFFKYDPIPFIESDVFLNGCYQSEKYFEDYKQDIYNRYSCPDQVEKNLHSTFKQLAKACFIHVRRGDFMYLPKYDLKLFDKYYPTAIESVLEKSREKKEDVFFYVLSNDLQWCTQHPLFKKLHNDKVLDFIDCNEVIGLWLMQCCARGGICANSTYSWWGGWLNKIKHSGNSEKKEKNVHFPSRILDDEEDYSDVISNLFTVIKE